MRTLVIGAGMAGLTLAARLGQQGRPPLIVERSTAPGAGHAIGLYPLGSSVFHGLGTYERLLRQSTSVERYELADGRGRPLQAFDMSMLTAAVGPMLMTSRADLVRLLEASGTGAQLRRGVSVESIVSREHDVEVAFDDGTRHHFDAVIGCDGITSASRDMVFGPATGFDSGWVLWTWWTSPGGFPPKVVREWWGDRFFFGVYPAPGTVMCAAGGPSDRLTGDDPERLLRDGLAPLIDADPAIGDAIGAAGGGHRWPMRDVRAADWTRDRIALCGDAAVGFLPTAGVGASYAMGAAAALADELSRADAATVPLALARYEQRCRSIVERSQTESRWLARVMFLRRPALAGLRDQVARHYPAKRMLGQIIKSQRAPF